MNLTGISLAITAIVLLSVSSPAQTDSLRQRDFMCGNDQPLTQWDSLYGPWPHLVVSATWAVLSPDRKFLAFNFENLRSPFLSGVQIYDLQHQSKFVFFPGEFSPKWHPFENKLLTPFIVYDLATDKEIILPVQCNGASYWSPNGKFIYYHSCSNDRWALLRSSSTGQDTVSLEHFPVYSYPVTDSTLLHFTEKGIEIITIETNERKITDLQWKSEMRIIHHVNISSDGRFVLADFWENGRTRYSGKQFLGMLDLQTNMLKSILPSQRLGHDYYPSWTSSGTILISYVCRTDSVYGVWEIDTNGVFLGQLLGKESLRSLTNVEGTLQTPSGFSINSFFPHPGNLEGILEYDVEKAGIYSLNLIDLSGKLFRTLLENVWRDSGRHRVTVRMEGLPPGMYLIRMSDPRNRPIYHRIIVER